MNTTATQKRIETGQRVTFAGHADRTYIVLQGATAPGQARIALDGSKFSSFAPVASLEVAG